ncbi:MAG TPA: universal stress protein [Chitinophagaceae bacterium]
MSSFFKSILIPVDFTANTEVAVKQAIELACTNGSTIHLLHVTKPRALWRVIRIINLFRSSPNKYYYPKKVKSKLQEWKFAIEESVSDCKVKTYVKEGNVCAKIRDAANEIKPQLIIIGKSNSDKHYSLLKSVCPNKLAKSTGYPVLTVMKNTLHSKIKIIVVPVRSFIPHRKIDLVTELAKKYRAAIHLVTIPDKIVIDESKKSSFLETFRILKNSLTSPIEHHIMEGHNLPKAILEYAECVGADLILVNPGTETKISNLTGKHINDLLTESSKLRVLSIEPYQND